jgi:Restriction endonuclease
MKKDSEEFPVLADSASLEPERNGIVCRPHCAAQAPYLPLTQLSDRHFEILVHDLLHAEQTASSDYDALQVLPYGADKGRDIVLFKSQSPVGVVQCKRYSRSIGLDEILVEIFKFLLFSMNDKNLEFSYDEFQYEFWTAKDLTEEAATFFKSPSITFDKKERDLRGLVDAARKKAKALQRTQSNEDNEAEIKATIQTAKLLKLTHVGPDAIARRLVQAAGKA